MDQNGDSTEARNKRKQPPTPSNDRPMKQIKPENDTHSRNGAYVAASPDLQAMDDTPSLGLEDSLDELPSTIISGTVHDSAEWQNMIEGVVKNVVSIHFCQTCSFDTDPAVASEATGFVVDAEKGYILTNRVCSLGPCVEGS
jgi:S1-C subfamily serine protease